MNKPLHVQVAKALGWTDIYENADFEPDNMAYGPSTYTGKDPADGQTKKIPDYGSTFCATGPLIVHYGILLGPEYEVVDGLFVFANKWGAKLGSDRTGETIVYGPSACETVARLIVSLHERGELQRI